MSTIITKRQFPHYHKYTMDLAGRPLTLEVGKLAELANAAVMVGYGDTRVLCCVTAAPRPRDGIDFFPLSVDFEEKMYSVGRIPGSFNRREGRPGEKGILTSRVIDRPIRPLFPSDFRNDVSIMATVMSVDHDCSPEIAALIGTSAALAISDIPWNGPVGALKVGLVNGELVLNPNSEQRKVSDLDVTVVSTGKKVVMIEAGANEVDNDTMYKAIELAHNENQKQVELINRMVAEIGKPKFDYPHASFNQELFDKIVENFMDEAKESLQEVVEFLHNPGKYVEIGAKLPKGALLVGPPGTGKTLLAKAVAGEAHVPFFSLSGSEFVEMFVGVGASRVRDLFEEAKKNAPCIVFIDEIDAIGKSRDSHYGGGNDEREQTLNQLLAEMDGFDTSKGLLILAATNRPEVLDPALLRPGRFDRRVIVDRPDLKGRIDILKVHAKNVRLDDTVDFEAIALATSGAVGSDLANMVNEAAILAVKNGRHAVSQKDLQESVEVVLVGKEKKDRILSAQERRIVSYHEVGHALVSALQKDAEPVQNN